MRASWTRTGRRRIRKSRFAQWLGPEPPDLSDCLPFTATDWEGVVWSNGSTGGARIGAVHGRTAAVRHDWLSRGEDGYLIECSPEHPHLRTICEAAAPALAYGTVHARATVVDTAAPVQIDASAGVLQAIVNETSS